MIKLRIHFEAVKEDGTIALEKDYSLCEDNWKHILMPVCAAVAAETQEFIREMIRKDKQ